MLAAPVYRPGPAVVLALLLAAGPACAQDYPSKPIRVVIPFTIGGGPDVVGRILMQKMADQMGQQIVIDNRVGAGGNIAAELVINSTPDGYTLLFPLDTVITANAHLFRRQSFDAARDLVPITQAGVSGLVMVVPAGPKAMNVAELIAAAKANPGQINMASAGTGSPVHLAGELFNFMAGTKMTHVPYKGSPQAMVDLVAGIVQMTIPSITAALPMIKAGRVKPIGVTPAKRNSALPDVPTIAEAGVPGYEVDIWAGVFAPVKTPPAVVARLYAETRKALEDPAVRAGFQAQGMEVTGTTPQQLAATIARESKKWKQVIDAVGIRSGG